MILSGNEIKKEIGKSIILEPYNEKQLNPNSYNLKLAPELLIYRPECAIVEHGNLEYITVLDAKEDNRTEKIIIPSDGIILQPGILYLGKTYEYTESHKYLPCLEGRSSIGRLGIFVHITAGYGDVGYRGNWTLEISCIHPVKIYPFMEICQIYYQEVKGDVTPYTGKYQNSRDILSSKIYEEYENG